MAADGSIIIDTAIDTEGFKNGFNDIRHSLHRIASTLEYMVDLCVDFQSGFTQGMSAAEHSAEGLTKSAKKAKKEVQNLSDLNIDRGQENQVDMDYDGPLEDSKFVDEKAFRVLTSDIEETKYQINSLQAEIQRTKTALKEMEAAGKYFGDIDYDEAYTELQMLNQEVKEYQRRLNLDASLNPFDADTFAGKIREAELELAKLAEAGKGLGNEEFDQAYRKLSLLKEEAKEYAKELSKTPDHTLKSVGEDARISRKKIADLNRELIQLKDRQKELSAAGVGYGYKEYDDNAKRIAKLEKRLKKYEEAVTGAKKKTKSFSRVLQGTANSISRMASVVAKTTGALAKGARDGAKAMSGLNRHTNNSRMTMGKMLGMSILFSTVFRALSAVTNGIGEGFNNLAVYSDDTNASLSALLSATIQLKNAFATAFAPLLNVAAPILVTFINLISRALTYVGMFFAALTGQDSFVKAVGVQQDYRTTLSGTAESANDAADATNHLADATKKADKANESYLSGLDEVNKWQSAEKDADSGTGSGAGGGVSLPSGGIVTPEDMFETVPIKNTIKDLVKKIKKYLKNEDWEGLGEFVADGLNKGMEKIYDVISWDNVGPEVTAFANGFTTTFNSMVGNLDFDLAGRVVGAGVNDLVRTFNLLIGPGGIDFVLLGMKLSQGMRGAVGEIEWFELGSLLGNYFMISWNLFGGFVSDMAQENDAGITGWQELGQSLGNSVNGLGDSIDFTQVGLTLTGGINGLFETLLEFAQTIEWDEMADNVSEGINASFENLEWADAGRSLNTFLGNLIGFLVDILEQTNWDELGEGVGEFLGEIEWGKHLWTMISAIASAIGEGFDGLEESGTAGKIVAFLGKAFIAVKIADITGVGTLVKKLIGKIGTNLISEDSISSVADKLKSLFGSGTKEAGDLLTDLGEAAGGAGGGFSTLAQKIGPLVGTAGLVLGLTAGVIELTKGIAGLIEKIQGGNGILSTMGASIKDLAGNLQQAGALSQEQTEEIWGLVEAWETEGLTAQEMVDNLMVKFSEWGLSTQQVSTVLQDNNYWTSQVKDNVDLLTQSAGQLGEGMSKTAGDIDLSSVSMKDAMGGMRDALYELSLSGGEFSGTYQNVLREFDETVSHSTTAQGALDLLAGQLEAAGVPADEFVKVLSEKFPQATQAVKTSVDKNIPAARQTVDEELGSAEATVDSTTAGMKSAAEENLSGMQTAAEQSATGVNDATVLSWGNSAREVTLKVRDMKNAASAELANMTKTVTSYSESMYNIMSKKWEALAKRIEQIIGDMNSSEIKPGLSNTVDILESEWRVAENRTAQTWKRIGHIVADSVADMSSDIRRQMNSVISTVNYGIGNINYSISGIEAAMNFGPWEIPTATGSRVIGFSASFPRVPHVPYLASGAVIPPRSEFLAVLGDQKHGNNIEAPENLIRKIVREESGAVSGGGNYRFIAQLNRRTLFDEVIEEAKLRRDINGDNPFLLT